MALTLNELAQKIGARIIRGNPELLIGRASSLLDASPDCIAPFTDTVYAEQLATTRAAVVISKIEELPVLPESVALLHSPDPEMAFVGAINALHPAIQEKPGVDSRSCVEPGVELGADVYVGPFVVVRSGSKIGARSVIHANVVIGRDCVIGEDCVIHPNVVLYDDVRLGNRCVIHGGTVLGSDGFGYKFRGGRHVKVPQVGGVEIGDDVEIGSNSSVDRAALGTTRIGSGTKIDNLVQVAHNVSIGKHCILCGQAGVAGSSAMGDYAVLGGRAALADRAVMGKASKAGGGSGIMKDIPAGEEVFGYPAVPRKAAFRQAASLSRLPELFQRVRELEKLLQKREGPAS